MSFQQRKVEFNPLNSIGSIIMMIVVMVGIYYIATGIFSFLAYIAPALLIGALVINYRVVTGYGKTLINLLRKNPLMGVLGVVLTIFAFPLVAGFLFGKALLTRKVKQLQKEAEKQRYGEFVDYEEVENDIVDDVPHIELPPIQKKSNTKDREDYEQYFD